MDERLPLVPDPTTVPAGSRLLVRMADGRVEIVVPWTQPGRVMWLDGHEMKGLDIGQVTDAMLITPDKPFGSAHWKQLTQDERDLLYWGALEALSARPGFQRIVADA